MKIENYSPTIRRKEMDAVLTAMVGERIGPGDRTIKLLQTAKEYLEFEFCLALRSPVSALSFALQALDIPEGSSVIISTLAPRYYTFVVGALKLKAIYADVDEKTASLSADSVRSVLSSDVRAIVAHHTLGLIPDTVSLTEFGLPIIEDCSQSYGAHRDGRRAGTVGIFTILGLEERDVLTAGGGALLYTHDRRAGTVLRRYADYPNEYRLPDLNAALALVQFKEAERNFQKRREIAAVYEQAAARTRHVRLRQAGDDESNYFSFPMVLVTGAKDVSAYCAKKEISLENAFPDASLASDDAAMEKFPVAVSLALRTVLFPIYPRLSKAQVEKAAKVLATLP